MLAGLLATLPQGDPQKREGSEEPNGQGKFSGKRPLLPGAAGLLGDSPRRGTGRKRVLHPRLSRPVQSPGPAEQGARVAPRSERLQDPGDVEGLSEALGGI